MSSSESVDIIVLPRVSRQSVAMIVLPCVKL